MTRPIRVSEHALIRYLERGWGVDMKLRRRIAMDATDTGKKITDHMLVQYLKDDLGFDVETLRDRIARIATGVLDKNPDLATLLNSDKYKINSNGLVFQFRTRKTGTTLVTITGNRRNRDVLSNRALRLQDKHGQKDRESK